MTAYRVLNRHDLLTIVRREREKRGLTHLEMDEHVGLGSGHYGKLELMGTSWGKEGFRMTSAIVWVLDFLNLELILAPRGEIPAETIERDVRLVPVIETPREAQGAMSGVSLIAEWRERRRLAQAGRRTKKNPPQRELQRVSMG